MLIERAGYFRIGRQRSFFVLGQFALGLLALKCAKLELANVLFQAADPRTAGAELAVHIRPGEPQSEDRGDRADRDGQEAFTLVHFAPPSAEGRRGPLLLVFAAGAAGCGPSSSGGTTVTVS